MRILLTGASGFTGRHFQEHVQQAGHRVESLAANLTAPSAIQQALRLHGKVDAVVHLAAISFVGHSNDAEFYAVNTVGTTNLLSALSALPKHERPAKVLIASSANVYGNCPHSPIFETQFPVPVNHYAASKLAMEHLALTFLDRLPIIITRPFNYTGPGQSLSFLVPKLVDHFVRRAHTVELGNLHVEREFNDVSLVTDSYLRLISAGVSGEIYNVCSGVTYSLSQVIEALTELTGHSIEIKVNPALVRANEVHHLCGSAKKLEDCIGNLKRTTLKDCLLRMTQQHLL